MSHTALYNPTEISVSERIKRTIEDLYEYKYRKIVEIIQQIYYRLQNFYHRTNEESPKQVLKKCKTKSNRIQKIAQLILRKQKKRKK